MTGKVPAGALKGRDVLIGASAIELGDRYPVPGRGVIAGPMIQILAAETLIQGSAPFDHGPVLPMLVALGLLGLAMRREGMRRNATLFGGAAFLLILPMATKVSGLGVFSVGPALLALLTGGWPCWSTPPSMPRARRAMSIPKPACPMPARFANWPAQPRAAAPSSSVSPISAMSRACWAAPMPPNC
jgi:hypothetical protein